MVLGICHGQKIVQVDGGPAFGRALCVVVVRDLRFGFFQVFNAFGSVRTIVGVTGTYQVEDIGILWIFFFKGKQDGQSFVRFEVVKQVLGLVEALGKIHSLGLQKGRQEDGRNREKYGSHALSKLNRVGYTQERE